MGAEDFKRHVLEFIRLNPEAILEIHSALLESGYPGELPWLSEPQAAESEPASEDSAQFQSGIEGYARIPAVYFLEVQLQLEAAIAHHSYLQQSLEDLLISDCTQVHTQAPSPEIISVLHSEVDAEDLLDILLRLNELLWSQGPGGPRPLRLKGAKEKIFQDLFRVEAVLLIEAIADTCPYYLKGPGRLDLCRSPLDLLAFLNGEEDPVVLDVVEGVRGAGHFVPRASAPRYALESLMRVHRQIPFATLQPIVESALIRFGSLSSSQD